MSKIEINFDNIKYNLYEILNVPVDATETVIKKKFMKVIKNFHPDKNSDIEEEIYYHLILSNQILLNKDSRKKYDEFLLGKADTFNELKDSFNKSKQNIEQILPDENTCKKLFNNKIDELNKKHGYSENSINESVSDRFNRIKGSRGLEIKIDKEDIKSIKEFNNKFDTNKTDGKFKNQIIEYKGLPSELSTYVAGEHYTSLSDLDKLYIEDSVQCSKYSSLDRAFMLQPVNETLNLNKSFNERMEDYKSQTEQYKNMHPTDFSTKKFNEW